MKYAKRFGWVMAGLLIAGLASAWTNARGKEPEPHRLSVVATDSIEGKNAFIFKDSNSAGCWLLVASRSNDGPMSLAPAPAAACQQH